MASAASKPFSGWATACRAAKSFDGGTPEGAATLWRPLRLVLRVGVLGGIRSASDKNRFAPVHRRRRTDAHGVDGSRDTSGARHAPERCWHPVPVGAAGSFHRLASRTAPAVCDHPIRRSRDRAGRWNRPSLWTWSRQPGRRSHRTRSYDARRWRSAASDGNHPARRLT